MLHNAVQLRVGKEAELLETVLNTETVINQNTESLFWNRLQRLSALDQEPSTIC